MTVYFFFFCFFAFLNFFRAQILEWNERFSSYSISYMYKDFFHGKMYNSFFFLYQ